MCMLVLAAGGKAVDFVGAHTGEILVISRVPRREMHRCFTLTDTYLLHVLGARRTGAVAASWYGGCCCCRSLDGRCGSYCCCCCYSASLPCGATAVLVTVPHVRVLLTLLSSQPCEETAVFSLAVFLLYRQQPGPLAAGVLIVRGLRPQMQPYRRRSPAEAPARSPLNHSLCQRAPHRCNRTLDQATRHWALPPDTGPCFPIP